MLRSRPARQPRRAMRANAWAVPICISVGVFGLGTGLLPTVLTVAALEEYLAHRAASETEGES